MNAHTQPADVISLEKLRNNFRDFRNIVRREKTNILVLYREEPVAVFAPFKESENLGKQIVDYSSSEFRQKLTDCWTSLSVGDVDAYVVNLYGRPFAVFRRVKPEDLKDFN